MLSLPWGWSEHGEVFKYWGVFIISILKYVWKWLPVRTYHVGTRKLICEANQCTGTCLMQFLSKGCSKQTMILHLRGSSKYTTALCFSIRGGDARVSTPSCTCSVEAFLEWHLMCWVNIWLECVFTLVQVRLSDVKNIL